MTLLFPCRSGFYDQNLWGHLTFSWNLKPNTMEDLYYSIENKSFFGWAQSDNTKTTIPRYDLTFYCISNGSGY